MTERSIGIAGLFALVASSVAAQTVELRLREESSDVAIVGAIVRLLGPQGPVAQGLTNELGRLALHAPAAGSYRLKIDRIGWTGITTSPVTLTDGQTLRIVVPMTSRRVELPVLEVTGKSRCDAKSQGGALAAALWEEIRKALTANLLSQGWSAVPLHLRQFVRELNLTRDVRREWVVVSTLTRRLPFPSLPPADLAQRGFVQQTNDSLQYAAPDAALLLSDEFVGTHCFQAVAGTAAIAGLGFEPAPGRARMPEVTGTLWVDRASSELRFLEYSYTGLEGILEKAQLGGRVEFRRLPTGAWIVSYWYIRMAHIDSVLRRVPGRGTPLPAFRVAGYEDHGGRAEPAGDTTGRVDRAVVIGHVRDSTTGSGLAGAVIRVRGQPDSVLSNAAGRFELAVAASGDQVVTASHAKLTALSSSTNRGALLSLGDSTFVSFQTPSMATIVRKACGPPRNRSGLVGILWDPEGKPAEGFEVQVQWRAPNAKREARATSGKGGIYVLCDLPAGPTLPVWLLDRNAYRIGGVDVELEWKEYRWLELRPGEREQ